METNLKYINLICTDLGGVGGHFTNLAGENEICTLLGGTGGHFTEIAALNEICTIQGVTAGHVQVLSALNAIAGVNKVTNLEGWKYIQVGTTLNENLNATLTSTGNGTGVATLRIEVLENQTLTITSGTTRFYTDAAGTLGESTTWNVTTGGLRTIYLKAPSGISVLNIPKPDKCQLGAQLGLGGAFWAVDGASRYNAPKISFDKTPFTSTLVLSLSNNFTITGSNANSVIYWRLEGTDAIAAFDGIINNAIYLNLNSLGLNYKITEIRGTGNISVLNLVKFRQTKMTSAEMVTLINSLTTRTGSLPNTITINDYADFASPPADVVTAVNALKAAKSITTVNLGA